jgi:hypothetical protein
VSLNQWSDRREAAIFQFQLWGPFNEPSEPWRTPLKDAINMSGTVTRPVQTVVPDRPRASLAYGLKSKFARRVSYVADNAHRSDRLPCRDTRDRPLRGAPWVELMLFLDRIGLEGRIIELGAISKPKFEHQQAEEPGMSVIRDSKRPSLTGRLAPRTNVTQKPVSRSPGPENTATTDKSTTAGRKWHADIVADANTGRATIILHFPTVGGVLRTHRIAAGQREELRKIRRERNRGPESDQAAYSNRTGRPAD